jgi:integrase
VATMKSESKRPSRRRRAPRELESADKLLPRYATVRSAGLERFTAGGKSPLVVRNLETVLNAWLRWCRLGDDAVVSREMDEAEFPRSLGLWSADMTQEGLAPRTISDRLEMIEAWRQVVVELTKGDVLPQAFADALADVIKRRGVSAPSLVKGCGVELSTLSAWRAGRRRPDLGQREQVVALEDALRLQQGTLSRRLGWPDERFVLYRNWKEHRDVLSTFGRRMRDLGASPQALSSGFALHENLRDEWAKLVAYKVEDVREHSTWDDTWRVKPVKEVGTRYGWYAVYRGDYFVPSACSTWSLVRRYLVWLCLDVPRGGAGYAAERVRTLGWLVREDLIDAYLRWHRGRCAGVVNRGVTSLLKQCVSLLRPRTGWLWLNPQVASAFDPADLPVALQGLDSSTPEFVEAWQSECARVWRCYVQRSTAFKNSKVRRPTRDPSEPIEDILNSPSPVGVLMTMLAKLKQTPLTMRTRKQRAVHLRDILLLSWLIANPLRANHFAVMTYKPDGTGNVYRHADGLWHYRCNSRDFKNESGDYDVSLPNFVGEALDAYLKDGRHVLGGASKSDFLFVSESGRGVSPTDVTGTELPSQPGLWSTECIGQRVRIITGGLRPGKKRFGPHAFRHIVATDYLKRMPGCYQLVAHLLRDQIQTVLEVYGHISPQDGLMLHYAAAQRELDRALGREVEAEGSMPVQLVEPVTRAQLAPPRRRCGSNR